LQRKFASLFPYFLINQATGMLSIERVKELLGNQKISDKEAEEIRDGFRVLAEIILEQWKEKRLKGNKPDNPLNKSKKIR
jgi:signal-transduction protein with cAMP-binding, CBS, and nucleotidyltransferase domain